MLSFFAIIKKLYLTKNKFLQPAIESRRPDVWRLF